MLISYIFITETINHTIYFLTLCDSFLSHCASQEQTSANSNTMTLLQLWLKRKTPVFLNMFLVYDETSKAYKLMQFCDTLLIIISTKDSDLFKYVYKKWNVV